MGVDVAGAFCKPIALDELEVLLVRLKSQKKVMTAASLRQAIDDGQLVVHYLPKATFKGPRPLDHRRRRGARALGAPGVRPARIRATSSASPRRAG